MVSLIDPTKPADGVSAVKADLRQNLAHIKSEIEALQAAQAAFPTSGFTGRRNRLINGNFFHNNRAQSFINIPATGSTVYHVDRWHGFTASGGASMRMQRYANVDVPGFPHSTFMRVSTITAKTPATNDTHLFGQIVEPVMVYDLKWGTASARPVVLSFVARAGIAGNYVVRVSNGSDRTYLGQFNIAQSNTWEYKQVAIPGPTSGTFDPTNSGVFYMSVQFDLGSGSSRIGTQNTWLTNGSATTFAGAVQVCANTSAYLDTAGVMFEQDTVATPWEMPQPILEDMMCKRYYQVIAHYMGGYNVASGTIGYRQMFPTSMRAGPTVTLSSNNSINIGALSPAPTAQHLLVTAPVSVTGGYLMDVVYNLDAEYA